MPDPNQSLREHLIALLSGGQAHATFEDAIKDLPPKLRGAKPENFPHSPWMLLEHLRIAQHDILEFSRSEKHESPKWPEGYWPKNEAPPSADAWTKSVNQFKSDMKAMQDLIKNPKTDLFAKIALGRWTNNLARSPAASRSQRLPHRAVGGRPPVTRRLEVTIRKQKVIKTLTKCRPEVQAKRAPKGRTHATPNNAADRSSMTTSRGSPSWLSVSVVSALAKYYPHSLSPPLVNPYERPLNLRRDVSQNHIRRGMHMQRRRNQKK